MNALNSSIPETVNAVLDKQRYMNPPWVPDGVLEPWVPDGVLEPWVPDGVLEPWVPDEVLELFDQSKKIEDKIMAKQASNKKINNTIGKRSLIFACRTGCCVSNTIMNHFMYADDLPLVIFSP